MVDVKEGECRLNEHEPKPSDHEAPLKVGKVGPGTHEMDAVFDGLEEAVGGDRGGIFIGFKV